MLRVYDVDNSELISQHEFQAAPLDCCFLSDFNRVAVGGLTGGIHVFDVHGAKISQVGRHDAPVRCVRFHRPTSEFQFRWNPPSCLQLLGCLKEICAIKACVAFLECHSSIRAY